MCVTRTNALQRGTESEERAVGLEHMVPATLDQSSLQVGECELVAGSDVAVFSTRRKGRETWREESRMRSVLANKGWRSFSQERKRYVFHDSHSIKSQRHLKVQYGRATECRGSKRLHCLHIPGFPQPSTNVHCTTLTTVLGELELFDLLCLLAPLAPLNAIPSTHQLYRPFHSTPPHSSSQHTTWLKSPLHIFPLTSSAFPFA